MASGSTTLYYNGVTILNCQTATFEEESVMDPSETDQMCHQYTITVVGYISGKFQEVPSLVDVLPNPGGNDAALHHKTVKAALLAPRGELRYTLGTDSDGNGGTTLIESSPANPNGLGNYKNIDVGDGPHPQSFNIMQVTANNMLMVRYTIKTKLIHCGANDSGLSRHSGVLSNRWSCSDSLDGNLFTRRIWRGHLVTATSHLNPHDLRGHVVPRLAPGFRRESMDFNVSASGREMDYTIRDVEGYAAPPAPATDWRIHHSETVTAENSAMAIGDCTVEVWGDRKASKRELLKIAIIAANFKLDFLHFVGVKGNIDKQALVLNTSITDKSGSDGRNYISFNIRIQHIKQTPTLNVLSVLNGLPGVNKSNGLLGLPANRWGSLIPKEEYGGSYDPDLFGGGRKGEKTALSGPAGTVGAFISHLQSVCNNNHKINERIGTEYRSPDFATEYDKGSEITARVVDKVNDSIAPEWMSESNQEGAYTAWEMTSRYDVQEHTLQLPIADSELFDRESLGSASGTSTAAIIHMSAPTSLRVIKLKGSRIGERPELPKIPGEFTDENGIVFTRHKTADVIFSSDRMPDNVDLHTVQAEYVYFMSRPPIESDKVSIGYNPWSKLGLESAPESSRTIELS